MQCILVNLVLNAVNTGVGKQSYICKFCDGNEVYSEVMFEKIPLDVISEVIE